MNYRHKPEPDGSFALKSRLSNYENTKLFFIFIIAGSLNKSVIKILRLFEFVNLIRKVK